MHGHVDAMTSKPSERRSRNFALISIAGCAFIAGLLVWFFFTATAAEMLVKQGKVALSRRDFSAAIGLAESAIDQSPRLRSAWKLLAEAAGQGGQFDQSVRALKEYARLKADDAGELCIKLGSLWMRQNFVGPAQRAFKISERLSVRVRFSLQMQEQIAAVTGHSRETARCILELVKRDEFTRGDLLLLTALVPRLADKNRLDAILRADPTYKSPLLAVTLDELYLQHIDVAQRLLTEITSAEPGDIEAQGTLAELYARYLPEKFLDWHSHLVPEASDDARVWSARGKWLATSGHTASAIRCLHEALLREPEQLSTTVLLGQLLKTHGESELGNAFIERGRRMQKIVDLNERLAEPRAAESILPMIEELEAVGRFWEAWGWCDIHELTLPPKHPSVVACRKRIKPDLTPNLPRTKPGSLPGGEFAWGQFPLPDWSLLKSGEGTSPKILDQHPSTIQFEDQAPRVGLDFRFVNSYSPGSGRKIFETMGAGVAVLDFDMDGWPDLYFPQGSSTPAGTPEGPSDALYRNQNGERFVDVTRFTRIHETSYSQGVAAGDYNNDGFPDVYVANLGRNRLYRNNGDGTFTDTIDEAGLKQSVWTVSCAIADLNGDGNPELFDANYAQGKDVLTRTCPDAKGHPKVCRPTFFDSEPDTIADNLGDGTFREQQSEAGLDLPQGMGLGLVVADFNDDGRPDVFVANDMTANFLLINQQAEVGQSARFVDEALLRGVAFDEFGLAQACMGVACADINRDRQPDLFITNFARESNTLYLSQPGGFYHDATQSAGLREPSYDPLGFGTQFLDADRDGWYDIVVVNGHIDEFEGELFQMKAQFFQGHPDGRFTELFARQAGELFDVPRLGRGMALLDWNRDGRTDFVATDLEGPVLLAVNQTESPFPSLRLRLVGTQSSRDAIGAKVKIVEQSGEERVYQLTAGDGYESSNERVLEICLGAVERVDRVEIQWPSGTISVTSNVVLSGDWIAIEGRRDWIRRGD